MSIVSTLNAMPVIPPEVISGVVLVLAFIEVVRLVRAARQILSWAGDFKTRMFRKIRRYGKRKLWEILEEPDYEETEKTKPTAQDFVVIKPDDGETDNNDP